MSLKRSREGAPAQQLGGLRPLVDQILQQASDFFDQLRGSMGRRSNSDAMRSSKICRARWPWLCSSRSRIMAQLLVAGVD
jgi:hypothetical protein